MEKTKMTEREILTALLAGECDKGIAHEYFQKKLDALDKRNESAKVRAAKKRESLDELGEAVKAVLSDELMIADDVLGLITVDGASIAKVRSRLTKLVDMDLAVKEDVTFDDENGKKHKAKAYKLA